MSETPAPLIDCVLLDFTGEMHVDFAPQEFCLVRDGFYSRLRLPTRIMGLRVNDISPMAYRDMEWIGTVIRRQWSMLLPAVPFLLLGSFWMKASFGDWAAFAVSAFLFVFLGVFPLFLLLRGRKYVGMATGEQILLLPMDRDRKKVARILGLLKQLCPPETRWELDGTPFQDHGALDTRPPSVRAFHQKRYAAIMTLISAYADSQFFMTHGRFRPVAIVVGSVALVISLTWLTSSIIRGLRR